MRKTKKEFGLKGKDRDSYLQPLFGVFAARLGRIDRHDRQALHRSKNIYHTCPWPILATAGIYSDSDLLKELTEGDAMRTASLASAPGAVRESRCDEWPAGITYQM
jgi:hypothetical protein